MTKKSADGKKMFRQPPREGGKADAEKALLERQKKSEKLKELRLVKEAEDRAAEVLNPKKKKARRKSTIPAFVPQKGA